jgi:hypothetical protein
MPRTNVQMNDAYGLPKARVRLSVLFYGTEEVQMSHLGTREGEGNLHPEGPGDQELRSGGTDREGVERGRQRKSSRLREQVRVRIPARAHLYLRPMRL